MASTTVINANATSKVQPSTAPPIEPLKNDTARLYTHIHPILVLSVYAFKFPALVVDPVPTLLSTLAPLAVLQIAFVAVCLPPTGGTPSLKNKKPGEKKGKAPGKLEQGLNSKIVVRLHSHLYSLHWAFDSIFERTITDYGYSRHSYHSSLPRSPQHHSSPRLSFSSARLPPRITCTPSSLEPTSRCSAHCLWYTYTV